MSFFELLGTAGETPTGRSLVLPETWHQGRTAYGGVSSALALAEALRVGGALPPLRSAQFAMIAPLAGTLQLSARVLRQGRNATWMAAEIAGDKGVGFTASFVFMSPVASGLVTDGRPVPDDVIPVADAQPFVNERAPAFLRHHFDVRFARPRGPARQPDVCWWVRPRGHEALDPALALLLSADGLPPGVMPLLSPGVPVSTMHWHVNMLDAAPVTHDGWWLLRSVGDFARDGCSSQQMSAWNTDGRPVLAGMQSIAVFG